MSLTTSLYSGMNGMVTFGTAISLTSDNLANVETTGFKSGQATFTDIMDQTAYNTGILSSNQSPIAVPVMDISTNFTQGGMNYTGIATDLAIDGDGYFVVQDTETNTDYYTRAGDFNLVADETEVQALIDAGVSSVAVDDMDSLSTNILTTESGMVVQGYAVSADGTVGTTLTDIVIDTSQVTMAATSFVDMEVLLNTEDTPPGTTPYDPNDPSTYNYAADVTIYDSLGNAHDVQVQFVRSESEDLTWEYHIVLPASEVEGESNTGTYAALDEVSGNTAGKLVFHADGSLDTDNSVMPSTTFTWSAASDGQTATAQTVAFNFGANVTDSRSAFHSASALSSANVVNNLNQDGFGSGQLSELEIDKDGTVLGIFTNGYEKALYQVALARFINDEGLYAEGGNLFSSTYFSGQAELGYANTEGFGSIWSRNLETSNVDMSTEMINLIKFQRAYQANATVLRTANEMLTELKYLGGS